MLLKIKISQSMFFNDFDSNPLFANEGVVLALCLYKDELKDNELNEG